MQTYQTAVLFVDTLRSANNAAAKIDDPASSAQARMTLFRHQRNSYLCGVTLFLLLVLWRFQSMLQDLFAAERRAEAVASQAKSNNKHFDDVSSQRDTAVDVSGFLSTIINNNFLCFYCICFFFVFFCFFVYV